VSTRVFFDEDLARLRGFPEIAEDELIRYFALAEADRAFVDPGRGRSPRDRLGLAVQLCTLPWLGFVPDSVSAGPAVAVQRLADQLGVDAGVLAGYGEREQTRTESCGWCCPAALPAADSVPAVSRGSARRPSPR
jgi:hypothetical protein